jgi:hypothetical protein
MKKKITCSVIGIHQDVKNFAPYIIYDDTLDMIDELGREHRKIVKETDFAKILIESTGKMEKRQIKLQVEDTKDYNPQLWSKVKYLIPDRWYNQYLDEEIRKTMMKIPLKEFIEGQWSTKFHMNGCRCKFPDHKDKTASFHIYPITNTFYCFGCHHGGTLIDFLMTNDKMDIKQAISTIKAM